MTHAYGEINLNGIGYRIDPLSFKKRDITDFAPRASVPGGSVIMSDLGMYQPIVQSDWRHGFGFHWHLDEAGYLRTEGTVDTRQEGLAMLFTAATSSDTNNNAKEGFTYFNGAFYSWGAAGLRKYSSGSWSSVYSTAAVNFALNAGAYLFFCPDGARIQKMGLAGTITDAGLDANATDFKWLIIHNGYIYAGKDSSNQIHYSDQEDLSDLEGTSADPGTIYCGLGVFPTIGAISFAGNLYVSRLDGLWQVGEDKICRPVLKYDTAASTANFRSMAVINGYLIFPMRDSIFQWNSIRVTDITPNKISDNFPFTTYGRFDNFVVADDRFLFCTARTNETTYDEVLLCWDGTGWHKLMTLITDSTTDAITAMGYDVGNNYLWYHLDSTADATYYIPFQGLSVFPYANFPTSGTHSLITSRIDGGFRRVKKSMPSIMVTAEELTSTRYIKVYYQLDGDGTWTEWGNINEDGVTELTSPGSARTREFNYIQLRFDFITATATISPILYDYTIRVILRPNVLWGWNFDIILADELEHDMLTDLRSAEEALADLETARDSKSPISFKDIFGVEHYGYISAMSDAVVYRTEADEDEVDKYELVANVNVVEMG